MEQLLLGLLRPKGLHDPHADQVFLEHCCKHTHLSLHRPPDYPHSPPNLDGGVNGDGHPGQAYQRQLPVDNEQQGRYSAYEDGQLEGPHHAKVDELAGALHVVGNDRHEIARVPLVVKGEAQSLHPVEQGVLEGIGNPGGDVLRKVGLAVAEGAPNDADKQERNTQDNQAAPVPFGEHLVNGVANEPGNG